MNPRPDDILRREFQHGRIAYGFQWNIAHHKGLGHEEGDLSSLWAHLNSIHIGKVPERPFADPFYNRASKLRLSEMSAGQKVGFRKKLEREALVMSKEMREEKEREFRIKVNDIKILKKKYEKNLREVQKRLIKRIRKEVLEIVQEIGKKEGYLLIIENIGVLYSPNTLDVTDKIIEKYNANFVQETEKDPKAEKAQ